MSRSAVNPTEDALSIYESVLYLCDSPAFIWSARGPRILKTNENAARLFLHYPSHAGTSELDIDKAIPGWRNIPEKSNNSIWLDFKDNENKVKTFQVRNSCLDREHNIWATTLVSGFSSNNEKKAGSAVFFRSRNGIRRHSRFRFRLLSADQSYSEEGAGRLRRCRSRSRSRDRRRT